MDIVFTLNRGMNNGGGFFCLFFFLCTAYLRAKQAGVRFYIRHRDWPYNLWHDYFTTLEVEPTGLKNPMYCGHMDMDIDTWKYTIRDYKRTIHEIFQLKENLRQRASDIIATMPSSFIAVFVRRGDKWLEVRQPPSVSDILKCIRYDENTVFFIQTDDYGVVEEFKSILPNRIVSTVDPTKRGSYHSKLFKTWCNKPDAVSIEEKTREQIQSETNEMLVGLQVCSQASECWTDKTSNVGRFLKLYGKNVHIYPTDVCVYDDTVAHPAWEITESCKS